MIYAHRGSMVLAPENSAPAFDLALRLGADVLETDVRLSRDGRLVVFHDERLERTSDGRGRVREHTADALTELDAGCRHVGLDGAAWSGERAAIMTLDELLERYADVRLNIDLKDRDDDAADAAADTLARHGRDDRIIVGSFHGPTLARFRRRAPTIATAATRAEVAALYFGRLRRGAPLPFHALQIPPRYGVFDLASSRFLRAAAERSLETVYWTINDAARIRALAAAGVSGIVTDRVDIARDALRGG